MKTGKSLWIAIGALAFVLAQAGAQSAVTQAAGIDPALLAKANAGDAASQVKVGEIYAAGTGVMADPKQAADWYRKAADQGDIGGEIHLANLYRDGAGKKFSRDSSQTANHSLEQFSAFKISL